MSVIDISRTVAAKLKDSNGDLVSFDFYYGPEEYKLIDTQNQSNRFIYLDPVEGDIPGMISGNFREDYAFSFLVAKALPLDPSKADQEAAIWDVRPYAKQFLRRMFEEKNSDGVKWFLPFEGATIQEVRAFLATNIYGVIVKATIKERIPTETCDP